MIGGDGRARGQQTSQAQMGHLKNSGWNGLADWLKEKCPVNAVGLKGWDDWKRGHANDRQKSQAVSENLYHETIIYYSNNK